MKWTMGNLLWPFMYSKSFMLHIYKGLKWLVTVHGTQYCFGLIFHTALPHVRRSALLRRKTKQANENLFSPQDGDLKFNPFFLCLCLFVLLSYPLHSFLCLCVCVFSCKTVIGKEELGNVHAVKIDKCLLLVFEERKTYWVP